MNRILAMSLAAAAALTTVVLIAVQPATPAQADEPTAKGAQGAPTAAPAAPAAPATQPADDEVIKLPHVQLDLENRRIVIDARVCLQQGLLELLMCHVGTKEHESVLHTQARGSDIHAALLALGLAPGQPARWVQIGDIGRAIPPRGAGLKIDLHWTDAAGRKQSAPAGRWIRPLQADQAPPVGEWIFVGSALLPHGAYWADSSGELISVSNFASSVIDVPFESTDDNRELLFTAATDAIPPVGTAVTVVITPTPGGENADYARAIVTVDRHGRLTADGEPIALGQLDAWAQRYLERHARGQVVIRSAMRTMGYHTQRVYDELRMAGVWDILETRAGLAERILPRTAARARVRLAELRRDLAEADGLFGNPHGDGQRTLEQIEREIQELKRLESLWTEYALHIRRALVDFPPPRKQPDGPAGSDRPADADDGEGPDSP